MEITELREIRCPYPSSTGQICRAHLVDIEANCTGTIVTRCRNKHADGLKRLILLKLEDGLVKYKRLPDEKSNRRQYTADETVMISEDSDGCNCRDDR